MELDKQIEAVLFWRGESMTFTELCRAVQATSGEVRKALQALRERIEGRGIALIQTDESVALATAAEAHDFIERLRKDELSRDLGRAALETLSIVLYKGSVSRRDIEYIRGVNSTTILRSLLIRGLIERKQSESDERVFRYHPTIELLSLLGITSAKDLPEFAAVSAELETAEKAAKETPPADEEAVTEESEPEHA